MSNSHPHDDIKPYAASDKAKKQQVEEMFDSIAGKYDFMNRFFSAGIDMAWRKKTIRLLEKDNPKHLLDMATGTADMVRTAGEGHVLSKLRINYSFHCQIFSRF